MIEKEEKEKTILIDKVHKYSYQCKQQDATIKRLITLHENDSLFHEFIVRSSLVSIYGYFENAVKTLSMEYCKYVLAHHDGDSVRVAYWMCNCSEMWKSYKKEKYNAKQQDEPKKKNPAATPTTFIDLLQQSFQKKFIDNVGLSFEYICFIGEWLFDSAFNKKEFQPTFVNFNNLRNIVAHGSEETINYGSITSIMNKIMHFIDIFFGKMIDVLSVNYDSSPRLI